MTLGDWITLLAAVVVLGCLVTWFSWTAGRLDRMHLRLETARAALDALLQRRAAIATELATSGLSDRASALLLLYAAQSARSPAADTGWQAQSDLTAALRIVTLPSAADDPLAAQLADISRQAAMARRIHNDLAATTRRMHDRRRVRWFKLAGRAAHPGSIDFDDAVTADS